MSKVLRSWFQQVDFVLIFIVLLLAGISLVVLYSIPDPDVPPLHHFYRQIMWYGLGFAVMLSMLFIDYRFLKWISIPLYVIGLISLGFVFMFDPVYNAQRWVQIGGFQFQPSEFMKIFLVIATAHLLVFHYQRLQKKAQDRHQKQLPRRWRNEWLLIAQIAIVSIIPFGMIVIQPDLGTALVLISIVGVMILVSGISWRSMFVLLFAVVSMIGSLVFMYFMNIPLFQKIVDGRDHWMRRIDAWLDPEGTAAREAYQLMQSMMAVGSGQLTGRGYLEGPQSQGQYIPFLHNDMIFANIGEEFGFVGASVLISLYFILIYRLVQIALSCTDPFGSYLVAGVIGMIFFQVFQNIGMTIGLLPVTGLALPFISAGGSALLTNMIAIGIALNVAMNGPQRGPQPS